MLFCFATAAAPRLSPLARFCRHTQPRDFTEQASRYYARHRHFAPPPMLISQRERIRHSCLPRQRLSRAFSEQY